MPIDMSLFFPRPRHWPSLKWLGGQDWLRIVPLPGFTSRMELDLRILRSPQARQHEEYLGMFLGFTQRSSRKDAGDLVTSTYIGSRAFAIGPKVFSPAPETCVALEHVDLNFPWSELRLPYPCLVVEFPEAWVTRMVQAYGLSQSPVAAMIGKVGPDQVHLWVRNREGGELHATITDRPEYRTIEEIMRAHEEQGRLTAAPAGAVPVSHGEQILKRVTVNLAVLLSHCGAKELGWADPQGQVRHKRKRGRRGEALAQGDLMRVGPAEAIKVFAVTKVRNQSDDAAGTQDRRSPHWRRGHWRMQPYGEGRACRKQIFIAPVFVCGENENIDPSEYPMRYKEGRL